MVNTANVARGLVRHIVILLLFSLTIAMKVSIETTWDNQPIVHQPAIIELKSLHDNDIQMDVEGTFFNDPPNPGGVPGEPFMGLWDFEVIELFLANDENQYVEIELGPWGQHIVLLLNGVHKTIRHSLPLRYKVIQRTESGRWQGQAIIPASYLPPNVTKMNAYAIHGSGVKRTYEALYPVPQGQFENPDFHRLDFFRPVNVSEFLAKPVTSFSPIWMESIESANN
ncbi:hypothetical protein GHT06_010505 [Daphnia sinensis]|uniref:Uncharacterized protein n=1 Tax=Daphnia sinensis TaxID=1820382 RepID=A0AAD5LIR2_9CRUS|nr:hypothetical protein GHT06_010505 [Daphnia sinensis]